MKKLIFIPVALIAISFASCKKDRTCSCSDATGSEVRKLVKVTKAQAEANCQTITYKDTASGDSSTETCKLS